MNLSRQHVSVFWKYFFWSGITTGAILLSLGLITLIYSTVGNNDTGSQITGLWLVFIGAIILAGSIDGEKHYKKWARKTQKPRKHTLDEI